MPCFYSLLGGWRTRERWGVREWRSVTVSFGKHHLPAIASHKLFPKGSFPAAKQKLLKALPLFCFQVASMRIDRTDSKL